MKRKTLKRIYDDNGVLTHKECSVCGDMKSVDEFYKSGQSTKSNDSFDSRCKSCVRGYKKTHLHKRIEINKKNPAKYFDDNGNTLTKYCPHCKEHKDRTDFSIKNNEKDGLNAYCKDCHNELKQKTIEFNKKNPVKYDGDDGVPLKKRCSKCKEEKLLREFHENYRYAGGLHTQCKCCTNAAISKRRNERRKTDPLYKLKHNIINLIRISLNRNGFKKNSHTAELVGCSYEFFKSYLESKFEPWMTWENYGKYKKGEYNYGWDIDHIIPISSAKNEEETIKLSHYTNLQPLCSNINRYVKRYKLDF